MESRTGRLAHEDRHAVGPAGFLPGEREPRRCQDDWRVRMEVTDVVDQGPRSLGVATCPYVVDEDVGTLGKVTRMPGQYRAAVTGGSATFDHVIAEATE